MATIYNKIVESVTEPSIDNLWLKEGKLYYYKGGWKPLTQEENVSTEDLKLLISEYSDGRQAIATALTNRRYPTEPSESFHAMADKITNMSYEEGWLAKIGYTKENDGGIQDAIDYSYELAKGWNPDGSTAQMFRNNTKIVFAPLVDTSQYSTLAYMFNGCTSLISVPQYDMKNLTSIQQIFDGCQLLSYLGVLQTSNVTSFLGAFQANKNLKVIKQIDFLKATNITSMIYGCPSLVFMQIINMGKSTLATYDLSGASAWGTGNEENRQSLIDSLITYSYDRASNGMATAIITLSTNTKALLTEEEIAQITAKGFTIA